MLFVADSALRREGWFRQVDDRGMPCGTSSAEQGSTYKVTLGWFNDSQGTEPAEDWQQANYLAVLVTAQQGGNETTRKELQKGLTARIERMLDGTDVWSEADSDCQV
jgi:hypothetical protein